MTLLQPSRDPNELDITLLLIHFFIVADEVRLRNYSLDFVQSYLKLSKLQCMWFKPRQQNHFKLCKRFIVTQSCRWYRFSLSARMFLRHYYHSFSLIEESFQTLRKVQGDVYMLTMLIKKTTNNSPSLMSLSVIGIADHQVAKELRIKTVQINSCRQFLSDAV